MSVRRLGVISLITVTFLLGWFFNAWSAAPTEERESYKKEVQEKLKALDKKIDELKGKGAHLEGDAKTEFNKEMTDLRKKRKVARKEWGKVKRASATTWEKAKADMDAAVQDVESAYEKAASRFKEHKE
jgi:chromosome segregation ATPase